MFEIAKKDVFKQVHLYLCIVYLFALLALPRIGGHFKASELLLPVLTVSTVMSAPYIRKIFGTRVLTAIALFFFFVILSNLISLLHFSAGIIYLLILPIRYVEIIVPLFAFAVSASLMPNHLLRSIKYIFFMLVIYVVLNFFIGFQAGYYGLVVLPGETGPNQVGIVFGLYTIFFLWLYLSRNYRISSVDIEKLSSGALILFLTALFLVILNVQRTSILAVIITSLLSFAVVLFIRYRKLLIQNVKVISLFAIASVGLVFFINQLGGEILDTLFRVISRFSAFDSASNVRLERWILFFNLEPWSEITTIFGVGLGSHNFFYDTNDFTLRFDSLPLRLLFEMGIVGLVFFFAFHILLLRLVYLRTKIIGLLAVLVAIFMMGMSMTFEAPFVYVPGSFFYMFIGIAVGLSYNERLRREKVIARKAD